jgi:hypothetical protein
MKFSANEACKTSSNPLCAPILLHVHHIRSVAEVFTLLARYIELLAVSLLPTFRDKLSVPSSTVR